MPSSMNRYSATTRAYFITGITILVLIGLFLLLIGFLIGAWLS